MLRIYGDAVALCADAASVARAIEMHDPDLARQLRRAAPSVALNIAEGSGSQGRNRNARYYNALGSAREVEGCFDAASAMRYTAPVSPAIRKRLDLVIGTLVTVLRLRS